MRSRCLTPFRASGHGLPALAVALGAVALLAPSGSAHRGTTFWAFNKVMRKVEGITVVYEGRRVKIDTRVTLCGGEGTVQMVRGVRRWKHFTCTNARPRRPLFDFRVHVLGPERFNTSVGF